MTIFTPDEYQTYCDYCDRICQDYQVYIPEPPQPNIFELLEDMNRATVNYPVLNHLFLV